MDIQTVLGITWYKASAGDILLLVAILMIPVCIYFLYVVMQKIKDKRIHDEQLFLFKLKRLGLSNFQIRIIHNLIGILGFSNPSRLLESTEYFETAIGRFLTHARATGETVDSQFMMCRDITVIYDKLYRHMRSKKPLKGIMDVEGEQLVYFSPIEDTVYLGRITSRDAKHLYVTIFGEPGDLPAGEIGNPVIFRLYRVGDAAYDFTAAIAGRDGKRLKLSIPEKIERREESRHPYIDVIIPAHVVKETVTRTAPDASPSAESGESEEQADIPPGITAALDEAEEKIPCTLYKLNDYEAMLRTTARLDFNYRYVLEFQVMDFNFRIVSTILATRTVDEGGALYYTVKFDEMSPSADSVLKRYIYEHL